MTLRTALALALTLCAAPALAAPPDWSGFYLGAYAGHAWGRAHATAPFAPEPGFFYNFGGDPYGFSADGLVAGGLAGHGWQAGGAVLGVEGELGYMDLGGERLDPNATDAGFDDTFTALQGGVYGAAYVRAGVPMGDGLLFVRAGVAVLDAEGSTVDACVAPPVGCGTHTLVMTGAETMVGWSLGGGVEWPLGDRLSLRLQYDWYDFGRLATAGSSTDGFAYEQTIGVKAHTARAGLSYRW
jgi:outer membrane immunogenic protein